MILSLDRLKSIACVKYAMVGDSEVVETSASLPTDGPPPRPRIIHASPKVILSLFASRASRVRDGCDGSEVVVETSIAALPTT